MNKKTKLVVKGYTELNSSERDDFKQAIADVDKGGEKRAGIYESIEGTTSQMDLGPMGSGGGCPCCGR